MVEQAPTAPWFGAPICAVSVVGDLSGIGHYCALDALGTPGDVPHTSAANLRSPRSGRLNLLDQAVALDALGVWGGTTEAARALLRRHVA